MSIGGGDCPKCGYPLGLGACEVCRLREQLARRRLADAGAYLRRLRAVREARGELAECEAALGRARELLEGSVEPALERSATEAPHSATRERPGCTRKRETPRDSGA